MITTIIDFFFWPIPPQPTADFLARYGNSFYWDNVLIKRDDKPPLPPWVRN